MPFIFYNRLKNSTINIHLRSMLFLLISFLWVSFDLQAQQTVAVGQVLNSADKSPIANVNIFFKNTDSAVQSNEEGYFMIRTSGKETTLVFSLIGFKQQEIKVKAGQSVGMQVELEEKNTVLQEVLILPGANPALEWMKKVRLYRKENDLNHQAGFTSQSIEQNLVLLTKVSRRSTNKYIFDQLKKGALSPSDSSVAVPLYMSESTFRQTDTERKELSNTIFSSPEVGKKVIANLVGEFATDLNFYDNAITIFGKSMISPLSNMGNIYYDFYLSDSLHTSTGKQYEIHFQSKNTKNLAFNGQLYIDSSSLALTRIEAELPKQANINFIHHLHVSQKFVTLRNKRWTRQSEEIALSMNYQLLADSLHPKPEIFVKRTTNYQTNDTIQWKEKDFAKSTYSTTTLNDKLKELNDTPLLRKAKRLADIILTGYIPMGKIDFGKIQQVARLTDIEGLRVNLPLRTNEKLWKNISIGGYVGYGFKNEAIKYSGTAQFKLSGEKRRVLSFNYTNDYRRFDYNYNDFLYRENPLVTGDEDISSTIIARRCADKMNERKEYALQFANDWNSDIETSFYFRSNELITSNSLPMQMENVNVNSVKQQSLTCVTRFSFRQKTYEDHLQRIYIANNKPILYSILEFGKYHLANKTGNYGKITGTIKHFVSLDIGQLNYNAEASWIIGTVPYTLLQTPAGSESGGYGFYTFNMMNFMEYAADKYINLHSELMLNGLVLNQIPIIKQLNLREMLSFNVAYGSLSTSHRNVLQFPDYVHSFNKPYMEIGVGVTNILHIFALQSVWRLTDLHHAGANKWAIQGCLSLSF